MRRFVSYGPAMVVLATAGGLLWLGPRLIYAFKAAGTRADITLARQALEGDDVLERINEAVRNVARAIEPGVVHIEMAGRFAGEPRRYGSAGSGWIFDQLGHIVTNAHVVGSAESVRVQLYDGRVLTGKVVGTDPLTDIAVVRVDAGVGLAPVPRASGGRLEQGDRVFAFGSPFGFKFSMSSGIVSGLGRSARGVLGAAGISNYIQTDAAVNPGNSGGPLVDIRGRLVGMNVAIATAQSSEGTTEGQSAGISFAIPLSTIEARVPQLIEGGRVSQGYLGVSRRGEGTRFVEAEASGGTPAFRGRGIPVSVQPDGPAAAGGLKDGDVIIAFDNEPTPDWQVLRAMINTARPQQAISLRVWREGQLLDLTVRLGSATPELRMSQINDLLRERVGVAVTESPRGVVVVLVRPEGRGEQAGLRAGMYILAVGGTRVDTLEGFLSALADRDFLAGKEVTLRVVGPEEGATQESEITVRGGP